MTPIRITTLVERPELADRLWDMKDPWPPFAAHDALAWLLYPRMTTELADCGPSPTCAAGCGPTR
ncbi:hypothetical protein [Streptomyces sp. NRRL F-2580]|uniref:hypothetical protein n=1 Tax=Streptomyces sp. NRRL F-2580 TaxID=1463841 RepID=UPI0006904729